MEWAWQSIWQCCNIKVYIDGTRWAFKKGFMSGRLGNFYHKSIPKKITGTYDVNEQQQNSILSLGNVKAKGAYLPSGKNHAYYISDNSDYDVILFLIDHKSVFPNLFKVVLGQLAPHITTEVDYKSLVS